MLNSTLIQPDPNTGLLQRLDFEYRLYQWLLNASIDQPVSLLRISYDLEKMSVEDKLIMSIDRNYRRIADSMRRLSSDKDVLGKIGKAEFGIVTRLNKEDVVEYAQNMCDGISGELQSTTNIKKTVSIGVITTNTVLSLESALNESHRCMIAAKALGGGQICTTDMLHQKAVESGMPLNLLTMEYKIRVQAEQTASDIAFQTRNTIKSLMEKADTDPLTGLKNKGYFDKRIARDISDAQQKDKPLVYALIDADNFGNINNEYDYVTGDAALRVIADVLRQEVRSNDWVVRYGGEEFVVVMPDTSLEDGARVVERIRSLISERSVPTKNNSQIKITVCGGVIQLADHEDSAKDLTARVSDVIHEAKKQKAKNTVAYQDLSVSSDILIKTLNDEAI